MADTGYNFKLCDALPSATASKLATRARLTSRYDKAVYTRPSKNTSILHPPGVQTNAEVAEAVDAPMLPIVHPKKERPAIAGPRQTRPPIHFCMLSSFFILSPAIFSDIT
jgi:hypothetical protein